MSHLSSRLWRRAVREDTSLKALLDYGRVPQMCERKARGIEEQEKLAQVA